MAYVFLGYVLTMQPDEVLPVDSLMDYLHPAFDFTSLIVNLQFSFYLPK